MPYVKLNPLVQWFLPPDPCAPTDLSANYNVSAGHAQVTWTPARGAKNYSVLAVTDRGLTDVCNTTGGSCFLHGLQCSQIYNVTVKAHNMACDDGMISEPYRFITGTVAGLETSCRLCFYTQSLHVAIIALFIQSLAHPAGSLSMWIASSLVPLFLGRRVTWPSVTWHIWRALAATALTVPAQEQRPSVK